MKKPTISFFPILLLRATFLMCLVLGGLNAAFGQSEEDIQAGVKDIFLDLQKRLDQSNVSDTSAMAVYLDAKEAVASVFEDKTRPRSVAQCIFGSVELASRLPNGQLLTQQTSDSIYAFKTESIDPADLAFYFFAAGILEFSRGDRAAARMWLDSALTIPRTLHNGDSYAATLKVRGFVNKYDKRYDEALRDFAEAKEVYAIFHDDLRAEIDILAASAEVQVERGDPALDVLATVERAIQLYEENIAQFQGWHNAYNIYTSYARVLSGTGNYEAADEAGQKALRLVEDLKDPFRIAIVQTAIADQLMIANRLNLARHHAEMGFQMFGKISKLSHMSDALETLIEADTKLGNYKSALEFSMLQREIKDSLQRSTQVHEIKRLQHSQAQTKILSELEVAQAQGRLLIAKRAEARMTLWFAISLLGLFVFIAFVLVYRLWARRRTHAILEKLVDRRTQELSEHAASLEEKNTELERFAFIASHDLKTPLRNITSFLDLANRRMSKQAKTEVGEYLDIAISYARQMNHIICDVLEFSKYESEPAYNKSRQQLRLIVDQAVKITRQEFEHRNPIITVEGNAEVFCDRDYVDQIILRLVNNALKFNTSAVPLVRIGIARSDNDFIEITVKDNGIGIEREYTSKIFDLFKRLNLQDEYSGTGLGLSIARKLARRMEGDVLVLDSNPGEGTSFVLRLPALPKAFIHDGGILESNAVTS